MTQVPIFTIGHGNRSIEEFVALLQRYEIAYVIDVRSQPYSRYNPQFSKHALEKALQVYALHYVFMGDTLGGRPSDPQCYVDGRVDYALLREMPFFQQGIKRLRTAWEKQLRVAIMCSEARPQECHRSKLIGNTLIEQQIAVAHIDETGECREQQVINQRLIGGQQSLFDDLSLVDVSGKVGRARKKRPPTGEVER